MKAEKFKICYIYDSLINDATSLKEFASFVNGIETKVRVAKDIIIIVPNEIDIEKIKISEQANVSKVYIITICESQYRTIDNYCKKVIDLILNKEINATHYFSRSSIFGRTILAQLSSYFGWGCVADVIDFDCYNNKISYVRSTHNDTVLSNIIIDTMPQAASFRQLLKCENDDLINIPKDKQEVYSIGDSTLLQVINKEFFEPQISSSVVLGVGRGVNEKALQYIKQYALLKGYTIVCTRPMVDYEHFFYEQQVGQSGRSITTDTYVAIGISGAIQHIMGLKNCKQIISINSDKNASIHQYSNVSFICDCEKFFQFILEQEKKNE